MEPKRAKLEPQTFFCTICCNPVKAPVIIPCDHLYCMKCITHFWDNKATYYCPLCMLPFSPRPDLVETAPCDVPIEAVTEARAKKKFSKKRINRSIYVRNQDIERLQREVRVNNEFSDKAVADTEEVFAELIRLMEKKRDDVKQQIRSQQEAEMSRVTTLQRKLEMEISELQELVPLEDYGLRRQKFYSFISLNEYIELPRGKVRNPSYAKHLTAAVSEVRDILQGVWVDGSKPKPTVTEVEAITVQLTEPRTRARLLEHARQIHLDPNTVSSIMVLSEDNSRVTVVEEEQSYSNHPDRFCYSQALSEESLTGRCYWEVEWEEGSTKTVVVAVAYKKISRSGYKCPCLFGLNENSWSFVFDGSNRFKYMHNKQRTPITGPCCNRLGVFIDQSLGILAFYAIAETTSHLICRIQTKFTEPLHAGLGFGQHGGSARICDLKEIGDIE